MKTPRERWGTCCPFDPECEHSFLGAEDLSRWMNKPITDAEAHEIDGSICDGCGHPYRPEEHVYGVSKCCPDCTHTGGTSDEG